ncbi:MAG TPA: hypothetical protein VHD61_08395 [Lacunisphaera sp.]|nr:hypothetical protein [Lacunisphaera sp.]
MHASSFLPRRGAAVLAGLTLALGGVGLRADTPAKQADAFPTFDNYIQIGVQAPSIDRNEAAFQQRTGQSKTTSGGIEAYHQAKDLGSDTTLTMDGRALGGAEDYLAQFNLAKTDLGTFEVGYKTFRTFYDGVGGFFPLDKKWNAMNPQDLHVDRGQFWVKATVKRPNTPEFEFSYTDSSRDGKKDSLIWGDSDYTGLPNNVPPISQVRKMVPSYRKLDERSQNFEATVRHSVGNTTYSLTYVHEKTDDNDIRYGNRFPGEVKPYPTPAATVLLTPDKMNSEIDYSETDGVNSKMDGITGKTETTITDKIKLSTGFGYQDLDATLTGDRPINTLTPTAVGPVWAPSDNFLNLLADSKVKVFSGLVALDFKPAPAFQARVAVSGEDKRTASTGSFTSVGSSVNATTGVVTVTQTPQVMFSRIKEKSLTPEVQLSYTGFRNTTFYFNGSKQLLDGDERYTTPYNPNTASNGTLANNTMDDSHLNANLGFNWAQSSVFNLRGEVFRKDHSNRSIGYNAGLGSSYVLGYKFDGFKVTATVKPLAQLAFTTRYIYQKGTADVAGVQPLFPTYDSMDAENHMFGETIDWNPTRQVYVQANANVVFNVLKTLNGRGGIAVGTGTNASYSADTVLRNSNNNYVSGSIVTGAVLSKEDNLEVRISYYKSDNYNPEVAVLSMPYGAAVKEASVSVGLKHKFSERMIGNARVGFYDSKNDTTGGNTNYHGPLAYLSLDYAL